MLKKSYALFFMVLCWGTVSLGESTPPSPSDAAEGSKSNALETVTPPVMADFDFEISMIRGLGGVISAEAQYLSLKKMHQQYESSKTSCVERQATAAQMCLESLSPELASTTASINTLLSMIGSVAVKDACGSFAKAMNIAKAGMSAYTSACGVARSGCSTSCQSAKKGLEGMKASIAALLATPSPCLGVTPQANFDNCEAHHGKATGLLNTLSTHVNAELQESKDAKSVASKTLVCVGKYADLLTSGIVGITTLAASLKQGQDCDNATDGSGTTGPDLTNLDVKCKIDEYKNTKECICHIDARQVGCVNSLEKPGAGGRESMSAGAGTGRSGSENSGVNLPTGLPNSMPEFASKSGNSAAGAGAPVGGGSGIGGGGSSGAGGGSGVGADGHKGLNTNILSGAGGGGGGGWGAAGSGSAADSKYRPYLPGGAKDPRRGVAGQGVSNEVTGQAGKSNWEKVRDRYRDNNSTLLNN